MRKRQTHWLGKVLVVLLVVSILALGGCTDEDTSATETLTIGMIGWSGWPPGVDQLHGTEVIIDMINQDGGLQVGSDRYLLEFKFYDTNGTQAGALAAANKAVYEDDVRFLTADNQFTEAFLSITEENKVILNADSATKATVGLGLNYTFYSDGSSFISQATTTWVYQNYPDAMETVCLVLTDDQMGHETEDVRLGPILQALNIPFEAVYFPADLTDLSAVATTVLDLDPTIVMVRGAGMQGDCNVVKALWQAGYEGKFLLGTMQTNVLLEFVPSGALDQIIHETTATDCEPPLTEMAEDFIDAYTARYGEWDYPNPITGEINGLLAAIQQAGSLDPDDIMEVVYGGMCFESLNGTVCMVPASPEVGYDPDNCRDSAATVVLRMYEDGEPINVIITPEEVIDLFKITHSDYDYNVR